MSFVRNETQQGRETREKVYEAIKSYNEEYGYPPTRREIGNKVGLKSTCTVQRHLRILKEQGRIFYEPLEPRTIKILEEKEKELKPVKGKSKFKIIKTVGMLSGYSDVSLRELNVVRCSDKKIGYDIRTFAADYKCENEGITLTTEEIKRLRDLLICMEL